MGRADGARRDARGTERAVGRARAARAARAVGVAALPREPGVFVERARCAGACHFGWAGGGADMGID